MYVKATLGQAKEQIDSSTLGLQPCSTQWLQLFNEATQRLLMGPEAWFDVHFKMQIEALSGCVTWPRNVANISSAALCNQPITLRNQWFEWLGSGYGLRCCRGTCDGQILDRGTAVTFRDIRHGYTIKVSTQTTESSGLEMGILGWNCEGNRVRTTDSDGNWRDGVWVPIPTSPNAPYIGQVQFALGGITEIIKPITNNYISLSDYNVTTEDEQLIGTYEHDEVRPSYRRSLIEGIPTNGTSQVSVMYRQDYIPVRNDNDFLLIANIPALSEMMQAVRLYRSNNFQLASGHEAIAMKLLDREVSHYIGEGTVQPLRIDYRNFGVGNLPTVY